MAIGFLVVLIDWSGRSLHVGSMSFGFTRKVQGYSGLLRGLLELMAALGPIEPNSQRLVGNTGFLLRNLI